MASASESVVTVNSSCGKSEPADHMNPDLEYLNVEEMPAMSTYDKDEQSCSMVFDFGSPDANEVTTSYVCDESELSLYFASALQNKLRLLRQSYVCSLVLRVGWSHALTSKSRLSVTNKNVC